MLYVDLYCVFAIGRAEMLSYDCRVCVISVIRIGDCHNLIAFSSLAVALNWKCTLLRVQPYVSLSLLSYSSSFSSCKCYNNIPQDSH